jgi:hypothetical protein
MFSQVKSVANKYLFQEIKNNILSNKELYRNYLEYLISISKDGIDNYFSIGPYQIIYNAKLNTHDAIIFFIFRKYIGKERLDSDLMGQFLACELTKNNSDINFETNGYYTLLDEEHTIKFLEHLYNNATIEEIYYG